MTKTSPFVTYLLEDAFAHIPGVTARAMFGGYGIYKDKLVFAIVVDDELYMKVGEKNKAEYEKAGSIPFTYPMKDGKLTTMSYWKLPPEILEDADEVKKWIEKSLAVHQEKKIARKK
jgi:DNA transformation protein